MPSDTAQATEPLTIDAEGAARLLGISTSHLFALRKSGRFGPAPVRLGRCVKFRVAELRAWVGAGCPGAARWAAMGGGKQ